MKKILISRRKGETQALILRDGELESYYIERDNEPPKFVGSIFWARVEKILPGMQAAFVDIGREQQAFLQFQNKNLREGEKILVQIEKDAEHYKAARATLEIALPSQKIILLPNSKKIHVSKKIPPAEKLRLQNLAQNFSTGAIIRTAAENSTAEDLAAEFDELLKLWGEITTAAQNKKKPALLYSEGLIEKILRENLSDCEMFTDNLKIFRQIEKSTAKINFCDGENLLQNYESEIKNLREKELNLPGGGFIVIEKTEALTAIDVNTGGADDIFQTNLEAAELLMKQIRLRNIGGIVIVDFINMKTGNRELLEYLKKLAQIDRGKIFIVDMTPLGLVEITRQPY